ncbi:MAG: hypothetical protein ABIE74_09655 [Pseudomonadota bacterium]
MKRFLGTLFLASIIMVNLSCGDGTNVSDALSGAPAGYKFTDTNGNAITSITRGTAAQLRSDAGNVIIQFTTSGSVNFTDLVTDRNTTKTIAHFPSDTEKAGLTGNVVLFIPCAADSTQVRVCPDATALTDVLEGCTNVVTLSSATPTSGNYTWDNVTTRSGATDCQVSATVANFGTGGEGISGPPVLTADDYPNVGVCVSTSKSVDVTSAEFKAAIAAATSFTFMHKPYGSDADIPFICGKQGTWNPSDTNAFAATNLINSTDSVAGIFTGDNVFICNSGFTFASNNKGFHDATTFRGEIRFTVGSTTYRARMRFTVTGTNAGKTLASLSLTDADVTMTNVIGTALSTVADVRNLWATNPSGFTINAVGNSTTQITTSGGFICAQTE